MAKSKQMLEARNLRRSGRSIKEISKKLMVSPGSVSVWCSDIILSKKQIRDLSKRVTDPYYGKKAEYLFRKKKELIEKINSLRLKGIQKIGILTEREIFLLGVALYWAEGFKKDHQVGFATSDIRMAKFFVRWLNICFDIPKESLLIRVTTNTSYRQTIDQIEEYWSKELGIARKNFSKPFFQETIWKKIYENKDDYHGVIRIRVRKSMDLLRMMLGFIEGISLT